jgi:hypothetical protein
LNTNQVIAVILSIACYLIGLIAGIFFLSQELNFFSENLLINSITIILSAFLFSLVFFGFLSFIPIGFLGILSKNFFYLNPIELILLLIPMSFAIYSGNLLGETIWKELKEGNVLKKNWKTIIVLIVIALILTLVIVFLSPQLNELIPIQSMIKLIEL